MIDSIQANTNLQIGKFDKEDEEKEWCCCYTCSPLFLTRKSLCGEERRDLKPTFVATDSTSAMAAAFSEPPMQVSSFLAGASLSKGFQILYEIL